ncbi:MAG: hypothetical protein C5B55_02655, partial [Blastocatellia bacterium]
STYGVRASVPFDFIVGDQTVHAGKITARGVTASNSGPLSITNLSSGQHTFRMATQILSASDSTQAKLVFRKYGDRYFLAQVCIPGYKAWEVSKSKSERALERESKLAQNSAAKHAAELVTVVAEMQ